MKDQAFYDKLERRIRFLQNEINSKKERLKVEQSLCDHPLSRVLVGPKLPVDMAGTFRAHHECGICGKKWSVDYT